MSTAIHEPHLTTYSGTTLPGISEIEAQAIRHEAATESIENEAAIAYTLNPTAANKARLLLASIDHGRALLAVINAIETAGGERMQPGRVRHG